MSKSLTNEEFISKLYKVNTHFKEGVFKVLSKVKKHPQSLIVKDKFGYCKMTANSLFKGAKPSISSSIFPKNYLINKLRSTRKDFYKNELVVVGEYVKDTDSILVKDKFGICNAKISNMHKGRRLSIGSSIDKTSYFINVIENLAPNTFDFTETTYGDTGDSGILVGCKKHGAFKTTPNIFMQRLSCVECTYEAIGDKRKSNTQSFIKKAIKIHNDEFDYSNVKYIEAKEKVKIKCNKKGHTFEMTPNSHLNGSKCSQCQSEFKVGSLKWWCNICIGKRGIIYILKCWDEKESFIKIGITCKTIKERYRKNKLMPYSYSVLEKYESDDLDSIFKIEANYKKYFKSELYSPKIKFGGSKTECFNINIVEEIKNKLKVSINNLVVSK